MLSQLPYGADSVLSLELPPGVLAAAWQAPAGEPLSDLGQAAAAALAAPLDFPPLRQAVVAGDSVAAPIEPGVPQAEQIVAALVLELLQAGVQPQDITILQTAEVGPEQAPDPRSALPADLASQVQLQIHDPADRNSLGYLGPNQQGEGVYLNRTLTDADLVVPIFVSHPAGERQASGGIYPAFGDADAQSRLRKAELNDEQESPLRRARQEAEDAARLLGAPFALTVVPGRGDEALHVVAGARESVAQKSNRLHREAWGAAPAGTASLVVATISGDVARQSWDVVGRVLQAARRLAAEDGAIAICSRLRNPPGRGVQSLAGADDRETAWKRLRKRPPADLLAAARLAAALDRGRVYLLSDLDPETIEDLGMAAVEDADEVARLAARHESCIVVADADRMVWE